MPGGDLCLSLKCQTTNEYVQLNKTSLQQLETNSHLHIPLKGDFLLLLWTSKGLFIKPTFKDISKNVGYLACSCAKGGPQRDSHLFWALHIKAIIPLEWSLKSAQLLPQSLMQKTI